MYSEEPWTVNLIKDAVKLITHANVCKFCCF